MTGYLPMCLPIIAIIVFSILLAMAVDVPCGDASLAGVDAGDLCQERQPLRARIVLSQRPNGSEPIDIFTIEVCGSVYSPLASDDTDMLVKITDISDGNNRADELPIMTNNRNVADGAGFCYRGPNGILPEGWSSLSDWTAITTIVLDSLRFARSGKRELQLSVSILSCQSGNPLAMANSTFVHENKSPGYLDVRDSRYQVRALAVALARTVAKKANSTTTKKRRVLRAWLSKYYPCPPWRSDYLGCGCFWFRCAVESARAKLLVWLGLDSNDLCHQLLKRSELAGRRSILELCMSVAAEDDRVSPEVLSHLSRLATYLDINHNNFTVMLERLVPVTIHENRDIDLILGLDPSMNKQTLRKYLGGKYRKWNRRVTHADAGVREQASIMLELIGQARNDTA